MLPLILFFASDPSANFKADLRACGIVETRALVEYRDDLQDYEMGVTGADAIANEALSCLAIVALKKGYIVTFSDMALAKQFGDVAGEQSLAAGEAMAQDWLSKRGKLATLPVRDQKRESLSSFAVRIERFCGVKPHRLLQSTGDYLTIRPKGVERMSYSDPALPCVLMAAAAARIGVGIIGNEAYSNTP